jgi:hypothetical protein
MADERQTKAKKSKAEETDAERRARRRKELFRIIVIILLVIIIILLLRQCGGCGTDESEDDDLPPAVAAVLGQMPSKSDEEIQAELDRLIEEGMFHISINTSPIFDDGASEGNLEIENVPNNLYAMLVTITLDDTGEVVYNSGLIYPNYYIQYDKLSVNLAKGEYPATAVFSAYDTETQEHIGDAAGQITIVVKN